MSIHVEEHELFHQYSPTEGSELHLAMTAELQVRAQRERAWQVLKERTQELRNLLCQMNGFDSDTPVAEVPLAQARAEGLRWLVKRIEQEIKELDEAYDLRARKVLALIGQREERNGRNGRRLPPTRPEDRSLPRGEQQSEYIPTG